MKNLLNILVEKNSLIQQEHDNRKRDYSKLHNIDLLEIWYYDIEKIEDIMRKALGLQLSA